MLALEDYYMEELSKTAYEIILILTLLELMLNKNNSDNVRKIRIIFFSPAIAQPTPFFLMCEK